MSLSPRETVTIDGVELELARAIESEDRWIGQREVLGQLLAAWSCIDESDRPLNPRLLGLPGVGKTTLAAAAARAAGLDLYIMQGTMDTRPEDLVITPVLDREDSSRLRYSASPLVTAMIRGGVCVLDEGNRMSEKSWASLAPLLDHRRYVESQIAGIRVEAHADFRFVTTMNRDGSTFELPEFIHSRLMPQIFLDFPEEHEERLIVALHVPLASDEVLAYVMAFLRAAHAADLRYTARDGINVARYALKVLEAAKKMGDEGLSAGDAVRQAVELAVDAADLDLCAPDDAPDTGPR